MSRTTDLHLLSHPTAGEPYVTIVEQASAVDRAYFENHPRESRYIRKAIPGELGGPMADYEGGFVVVTQIRPGARHRRLVHPGGRAQAVTA